MKVSRAKQKKKENRIQRSKANMRNVPKANKDSKHLVNRIDRLAKVKTGGK